MNAAKNTCCSIISKLITSMAILAAVFVSQNTHAQGIFGDDDGGFGGYGGYGGTVVGYSKADPTEVSKLYAKWIQDYKVKVNADGSRMIVQHRHTDLCRKNGYCDLKRDYVQVEVSKTNRVGRVVSDIARIRLAHELDSEKKSWLVEVVDATAAPSIQINPSAGAFDANWIIVDFEQLEDHELYDDRVFETPLNRKKEARRVQVPSYVGSPNKIERKLPVFCDRSEVFEYFEKTNVVVETESEIVETPILYLKPTMQDFSKWIRAGNSMSYRKQVSEPCSGCKGRGRWTEFQGGKQHLVTCSRCNGSGSRLVDKNITVKGP